MLRVIAIALTLFAGAALADDWKEYKNRDYSFTVVRDSGGLVGVNFATAFLRADGVRDAETSIELVVDDIVYTLELVGEDGVGLGSDFDGAEMPSGLGSAAGLQNLVAAMMTRGFDQPLIEKVCFNNWLRVLGRTWGEIN
jgi:membrane dipeptidase